MLGDCLRSQRVFMGWSEGASMHVHSSIAHPARLPHKNSLPLSSHKGVKNPSEAKLIVEIEPTLLGEL